MENNHKLGLYVSYYLSRFDDQAYLNLGFGNQEETHIKIGEILSVKPNTVKNWRDEFDPLFGHRAGWYQRPMNPSRIKVAQALENLEELQVRSIVEDIITGKIQEDPYVEKQLLSIASDGKRENSIHKFVLRVPTGKFAEEFFIKYFAENQKPIEGLLIDCRDLGIGYDFRIENNRKQYFVEVKGISDIFGGIFLTDKEWTTAKDEGSNYFLCIVSNISNIPKVDSIQNPYKRLNPRKNIYTTIQINWSVTENQLTELND